MTARRRAVVLGAFGVVLVAGVALVLAWPNGSDSTTANEARTAPGFELTLIDDQTRTWALADQTGTPVLVNFWASWCTPCRVEMPDIDDLVSRSDGRLVAVGVNVFDDADEAAAFAREIGVIYPLVADPTGTIAQAYEVTTIPTTVVIDARGRIAGIASGRPDAAALEAFVAESLGPDWNRPAD